MPPATSADIASKLASYDAKPVTSTDALNSALTQYGVPEIRQTVSGLRTTLANTQNAYNAVDPSVTGRTQGSLVTEAQRSKQVANERAPIAANITSQSQALNQNQSDLTDALGQAQTRASNQVNDYNAGRAALESQYQNVYKSEQDKVANVLATQQANTATSKASSANTTGYSAAKDKSGGTQFTYKGSPITAAQYYDTVGNATDLKNFLQNDANSKNAYKDYTSGKYTYDQLAKKYPYIFGGV